MNKIVLLTAIILFCGCKSQVKKDQSQIKIIPKPLELSAVQGMYELNSSTRIYFDQEASDLTGVGNQFINELEEATGIEIRPTDQMPRKNGIIVRKNENLGTEAYELAVEQSVVNITASTTAGVYYALQTIKQLLPVELSGNTKQNKGSCRIPALTIMDKPSFAWRGYMLDVSRHFYGTEDIKKVLDFMAMLKLNRFHWHLTDDQGWRIEIKKHPKLISVGAWRVDHNVTDENISNWWGRPVQKKGEEATYGGFYTQEEIKEIVDYAKERQIEIVPEIDVPGHSQAILASYPEVSCDNRKYNVATGGVYKDNALCASNPVTYQFLEEVLGEVMDLFPFNYIHIGGDECNKDGWKNHSGCQDFIKAKGLKDEQELQSFFIKQVEKMIQAKGKNLIGWDEILEGGLAPNATVMSWRGEKGGIAAAKAGHDVIMTPNYANYLDLKQGQPDFEPNLGYSEALLSTCYNYSVIPEGFTGKEASFILGLQGNLWTESISDWGKLTYMTFPRLFAVAENGWTPENLQNFDDFINRLGPQLKRLDEKDVRYAKSAFNVWIHQKGNGENIQITLDSELTSPEIRFTLDGTDPISNSELYFGPITLTSTQTIKTAIFKDGERLGDIREATFPVHKAAGAKVIYNNSYSGEDPAAKELALTDLNYGQLDARGDENWQGFTEDFDVTLLFNDPVEVKLVRLTSLRWTIAGKYPAAQVEVYGSTDGKKYSKIGESGFQETSLIQGRNKITLDTECRATSIKRLRVKARLLNPIPEGHHKAGSKSTLLVDEVVVL